MVVFWGHRISGRSWGSCFCEFVWRVGQSLPSHKSIDIIMFFWTTWSLGQRKKSNHVHLYGASLQTWCRSLWGTGGDRFGPHFANFDARPRKKPLRCFLIYGKTWEKPMLGKVFRRGTKTVGTKRGDMREVDSYFYINASSVQLPDSCHQGPFWRWVHLCSYACFFWISCSLCLFFPHAQWSKLKPLLICFILGIILHQSFIYFILLMIKTIEVRIPIKTNQYFQWFKSPSPGNEDDLLELLKDSISLNGEGQEGGVGDRVDGRWTRYHPWLSVDGWLVGRNPPRPRPTTNFGCRNV